MNSDSTGGESPAAPWLDQGNRHFEQKKLSKARRAYETAARLARVAGDRHLLALALHNQGAAFFGDGLRNEARRCYEEALSIQQELAQADSLEGQWMAVGATQHKLADLSLFDGRLDDAHQRINNALTIRLELLKRHPLRFLPDTVASMALLARIDEAQGRLEDAAKHFDGAVRGRRTLSRLDPGHLPALAATLDLLSGVCAKLGREEESRMHAQEAESIRAHVEGGTHISPSHLPLGPWDGKVH